MFREILGDEEKKGDTLKAVGKIIAFAFDDPFHITTVTGLTLYGIGKLREKRTNYGLKMMLRDIYAMHQELIREVNDL
ncbi:MAG: hypothetical protein OWQ54_02730 [Sulfolobaceae archaeon]|nr:hypothetical protein [Sulfolobaceae archaeon]